METRSTTRHPFAGLAALSVALLSFLTIVSAEIVASRVGLGSLIWTSRNYGRIDWVFVGIITLGILGFVFDRVLRIVASRVLRRYGVKL
nr:hypothetical protein OG999_48740 [Streptomyces sp. NBC_00886]